MIFGWLPIPCRRKSQLLGMAHLLYGASTDLLSLFPSPFLFPGTARRGCLLCLFCVVWLLLVFVGAALRPGMSFLLDSTQHTPTHLSLCTYLLHFEFPWHLEGNSRYESLAVIICEYLWTWIQELSFAPLYPLGLVQNLEYRRNLINVC